MAAANNSENSTHFYQTHSITAQKTAIFMLNECCCCSLNSATGKNPVKCYTFWGSEEETLESKKSFCNRLTDRTLLIDTTEWTVKTVSTKFDAIYLQISVEMYKDRLDLAKLHNEMTPEETQLYWCDKPTLLTWMLDDLLLSIFWKIPRQNIFNFVHNYKQTPNFSDH